MRALKNRTYLGTVVLVLAAAGLACALEDARPGADAMMQAWMRAATPGAAHKRLAASAGEWDTVVTHWQAPGAPPMETRGHSTIRVILDGRFLEEDSTGEMMGRPFHGRGLIGYDNLKEKYTSLWTDNMSTAMFTMLGDCTADHDVCRFQGSFDDALTGKAQTMRLVVTSQDDDHKRSEFWAPAPDGKEFKIMEIRHTRRK